MMLCGQAHSRTCEWRNSASCPGVFGGTMKPRISARLLRMRVVDQPARGEQLPDADAVRIDLRFAVLRAPLADLVHRDRLRFERAAALHRAGRHREVMVGKAEHELCLHAAALEMLERHRRMVDEG